ncbi:MAG: OsmC family protein [Actinomycetota bacterium]|nr:OsmC family protein [Actinomycetota bacterium]
MTGTTHTYRTTLAWEGSTGEGYDAYDRTHTVAAAPAQAALTLSADPAFKGDPSLLSPEQLLVLSASSCQLLSFIAVAARARIDVVAYRDSAEAVMPEDDLPVRITRIELRPAITIRTHGDAGPTDDRLSHLCEVAHQECYVANSLRTEVIVTPTFTR